MRLVTGLFLSLGLLVPVVADDGINDQVTPDQSAVSSPDDNVSTVLPDMENYESRGNYGEKQINSFSGWGNDKSEFRLYKPRFDDYHENSGSGSMRDFTY